MYAPDFGPRMVSVTNAPRALSREKGIGNETEETLFVSRGTVPFELGRACLSRSDSVMFDCRAHNVVASGFELSKTRPRGEILLL